MLLHSLCDIGVGDQTAEQRGNFGPDVHLLLEERQGLESANKFGSFACQLGNIRKANTPTNLKQSKVPVIKLILLASSVSAAEERAVFGMIPMVCESQQTVLSKQCCTV